MVWMWCRLFHVLQPLKVLIRWFYFINVVLVYRGSIIYKSNSLIVWLGSFWFGRLQSISIFEQDITLTNGFLFSSLTFWHGSLWFDSIWFDSFGLGTFKFGSFGLGSFELDDFTRYLVHIFTLKSRLLTRLILKHLQGFSYFLCMKGIFDAYVAWPSGEKFIFELCSNSC